MRSQSQPAGVFALEVTEVEVIGGIEQNSVEETESTVIDAQDEHHPAGGSFTSERETTWPKLNRRDSKRTSLQTGSREEY